MIEIFSLAERLERAGEPFVIATVVSAQSPTSAKPGDKAIITARGLIEGWIGGSCAEPTVVTHARLALEDGECRLLHISPNAEMKAGREGLCLVPMSCYSGGTLEIYLEPHLAEPHLVVFGHSPVARSLCALARVMKYRVTLVDPRQDAGVSSEASVIRDLAGLERIRADYAVVATHGVFDEDALEHAVRMQPSYVGLVASSRRAEAVRAALLSRGVDATALERLRSPAGIDVGAASAEEIALSILAEIVAVRRRAAPRGRGTDHSQPAIRTVETHACCSHAPASELPAQRVPSDGITAILLAAGESRRMRGINKLLLPIDGVPLVRRSAETLLASGIEPVLIVLGFEADRVREALAGLDVRFVMNDDYREGQETSVRAGLAAVSNAIEGVMICLADQPALTAADLREIKHAFLKRSRGSALVPMVRGQRGNPIVIDRQGVEQIRSRGGKFACLQFTTHYADLVEPYEMSNDHVLLDIDQPEDVASLGSGR